MQAALPYEREIIRAVTGVVSNAASVDHPLTVAKENPTKAGVLIVTSDSGFCGGFNANVGRASLRFIEEQKQKGVQEIRLLVVGRKGREYSRRRKLATRTPTACSAGRSSGWPTARAPSVSVKLLSRS